MRLPFETVDTFRRYSAIDPPAGDVDFFEFRRDLEEGTTFVATVVQSQIDSVMGLYYCPDDNAGPNWAYGRWWWWLSGAEVDLCRRGPDPVRDRSRRCGTCR